MRHSLLLLLPFVVYSAEPSTSAADLSWMSGCWTMTTGPVTIQEHWSTPAAGTMLGWSRTLKGDRMVFHEFMRISPSGGKLVYHARIGPASAGTPFTLRESSDGYALFENPDHDFPQRIVYKRTPDGMHARIEGTDKGKTRAEDFRMRRAPCQ